MTTDRTRLLGYMWLIALGLALVVSACAAYSSSNQLEERACGCDPFGYLRMAQKVRQARERGEYPDYRLETRQGRLLIEHMKSLGAPVKEWGEMVAPHAHHYFPESDSIGVQYPPGTGLFLACYPEGQAVHGMCRTVVWLFVGVGLVSLFIAGRAHAWAAAGGVVFALQLGFAIIDELGAISYSIDAVLAPLLMTCVLVHVGLGLRSGGHIRAAALTAFAAGVAFGFAILVRLPVVFLLPGVAILLIGATRRTLVNSTLIAFGLGLTLGGVLPLLVHQQRTTGSWSHSTYGSDDNSPPSLGVVEQNYAFYFQGGPGDWHNEALWISLIGFGALAVAARGGTPVPVGRIRVLASAGLIWGISIVFFLTHKIAIAYYQVPALFSAVTILALGGLIHQVSRRQSLEAENHAPMSCSRSRIVLRLASIVAFLPGVFALHSAWTVRHNLTVAEEFKARQTAFPDELTDANSWVLADILTGSLWYYAKKPSCKITFADAKTRAQVYRFVFGRGERQFVIRDCDSMQRIVAEIEQMGGILEHRGTVDDCPYYLVHWPSTGPRGDPAPTRP